MFSKVGRAAVGVEWVGGVGDGGGVWARVDEREAGLEG